MKYQRKTWHEILRLPHLSPAAAWNSPAISIQNCSVTFSRGYPSLLCRSWHPRQDRSLSAGRHQLFSSQRRAPLMVLVRSWSTRWAETTFSRRHFQITFLQWKFGLKFHKKLFPGFQLRTIWSSIVYEFVPNRRKIIIWKCVIRPQWVNKWAWATSSNVFSLINSTVFSIKFQWSLFPVVQLTTNYLLMGWPNFLPLARYRIFDIMKYSVLLDHDLC